MARLVGRLADWPEAVGVTGNPSDRQLGREGWQTARVAGGQGG